MKIEVQKSSLHQIKHLKAYFMTCFMQNAQKLNVLWCTAQSVCLETYGGPCTQIYVKEIELEIGN